MASDIQMNCATCGRKRFGLIGICMCPTPKPATVEPPVWTESAMLKLWWHERGHKGHGPCETCGMTARAFRENDGLCNRAVSEAGDRCGCDYGEGRQCPTHAGTVAPWKGWHAKIEGAEEAYAATFPDPEGPVFVRVLEPSAAKDLLRLVPIEPPARVDQPDELREGGVMEHDFFHVWGTIHECRICNLKTDNPSRTVAACLTKPATPEPPELPPLGEQFMLDGRPYVVTGVVQSAPSTPEEIIDRVTDAISDFTARRKAKREINRADAPLIPADIRKRVARLKERYRGDELARAMSAPLPHDPPMSARLMPWRGKE